MPLTDEQLATARARNDEYAYGLSVTADITLAMLLDEIDRLRVALVVGFCLGIFVGPPPIR
jgi:hypothetical protein